MVEQTTAARFFEGQVLHLVVLAMLLAAVWISAGQPPVTAGKFLGLSTGTWLALTVADAVAHQVYVWVCWRAELYGGTLTRWFGDRAFSLYAALFTILFAARPLLAFALGWSNRGTWDIHLWLGWGMALVLFVPSVYLIISVRRYFTFRRAFGIDHFDPTYRSLPMVREGIFRFSANAMYVFGFFMLWVPAFLFQSTAALVVAAFSHSYIWVHYYATERPDMKRIYEIDAVVE